MTSTQRIRDYKQLDVWRKSMQLTEEVYRITARMPNTERFALCDQMQRAVVSIPSNIAEGYGPGSRKEYCQFIKIARGSAAEVETQLLLTLRLDMLTRDNLAPVLELVAEVRRMLHGLVCSLER
ncbi:MAG: four helix bundle protein [Armatimonadota bacterium]